MWGSNHLGDPGPVFSFLCKRGKLNDLQYYNSNIILPSEKHRQNQQNKWCKKKLQNGCDEILLGNITVRFVTINDHRGETDRKWMKRQKVREWENTFSDGQGQQRGLYRVQSCRWECGPSATSYSDLIFPKETKTRSWLLVCRCGLLWWEDSMEAPMIPDVLRDSFSLVWAAWETCF